MKFNRFVCVMAVCALGVLMAACAKKEELPVETKATEVATEATTEEPQKVGMANPMVEITDSNEFKNQLGITIDASKLHTTPKMFIIDGKVADVIMEETNVNGEPIEYRLRATKDASIAPTMHGIYDELLDVAVIDVDCAGQTVKLDQKETKDKKTSVHSWQIGDVYYTLTINNQYSQNQYGAVMDSIFDAIGA